jgi:hypothetical protein
VRLEGKQKDKDDTALNGLKISCKNPTTNEEKWLTVHEGFWGSWKKAVVKKFQYVCGAQSRWEKKQDGGDDTALNGIKMRFCELKIAKAVRIDYDLK